jgi:hypothetical protein
MHSKARDRKNPKRSGLVPIASQSVERDARQGKMRAHEIAVLGQQH